MYPSIDVTVTVETEGMTYEGKLIRFRKETSNDGDGAVVGWFAALDRLDGVGHVNVYASPTTGGPTAIRTQDYEGRGASKYKRPIEQVVMSIDSDSPPLCPECEGEMILGHSEESDNRAIAGDGSRGRWVGGLLCPDCFPGRVHDDREKGLP
jgi:hypothetical protein